MQEANSYFSESIEFPTIIALSSPSFLSGIFDALVSTFRSASRKAFETPPITITARTAEKKILRNIIIPTKKFFTGKNISVLRTDARSTKSII